MIGLLPLGFTAPALLAALVLLPAIWWLLRLVPPRPRELLFPPTRLLAEIMKVEETPDRSPWWLTLLRLTLAGAVIIALAGPVWRPSVSADTGKGPLWLIIDNGWASASSWKARQTLAAGLVERAADRGRPVAIIATADGISQPLEPVGAALARSRLQGLEPRAWVPDRASLIAGLRSSAAKVAPGSIEWLSDGLDGPPGDGWTAALAGLAQSAPVIVHVGGTRVPLALVATENGLKSLDATLVRPSAGTAATGKLRALDQKGRSIGETDFTFEATATRAVAKFEMPTELRNDIARVEIADEGHAAAVQLLDERWRRRAVGLINGTISEADQPLLSPSHYLEAALKPFADVRKPPGDDLARSIRDLIRQNVSVIVMADVGTLVGETAKALEDWTGKGGVLIRFAGPRLAAVKGGDKLLPVDLRQGGRTLGGALSWSKPQALASFSPAGPFASLAMPTDVTVSRQVLAESHPDLNRKTWASLADGTPLVTADKLGNGWIVLFHVTADTSWSNLPLSGSFIEMLRRVIAFSVATGARLEATTDTGASTKVFLPPLRLLDGFGLPVSPSSDAKPIAEGSTGIAASREHPPGLYGTDDAFIALEPMQPTDTLTPLDLKALPTATVESYATDGPRDLKPTVFGLALLFLIIDSIAVLALAGQFRWRRATAALILSVGLIGASGLVAPPTLAQTSPAQLQPQKPAVAPLAAEPRLSPAEKATAERFDREAALGTRLAYIITGNAEIDEISKRGLEGLTRLLTDRTALEPAPPLGVDPSRDELALFPLLYWPIDPNGPQPSPKAMSRIDAFMKGGGTVVFDTRDALQSPLTLGSGRVSPATQALRRILAGLDIPELEPVPSDHVLTKSFYLLQDYPGRYEGGQLWVEATPAQTAAESAERPVRPGDGVSPIVITSNDLAGAWAIADNGDYFLQTVPPDPRQREMAYRVGVNIVMYTLTGNYKADQVHVPALLDRLGQ